MASGGEAPFTTDGTNWMTCSPTGQNSTLVNASMPQICEKIQNPQNRHVVGEIAADDAHRVGAAIADVVL